MNSAERHKARLLRVALWALSAAPFIVAGDAVMHQLADGGKDLSPPSFYLGNDADPGDAPTTLHLGEIGVFEHSKADAERYKLLHGPISEEDWKQAEKFLQEHSNSRWKQFDHLQRGEHKENLRRFLVNRWRGIAELKEMSPDLYKVKVREVEVDDEIFKYCFQIKRGHKDEALGQGKLKIAVDELFNLGLQERKVRIGLVEKSLVVQKKVLESDDRNKVQIVTERYEQVLKHGVEGARFDKAPGVKGKNGSSTSPISPGETELDSPEETPATKP